MPRSSDAPNLPDPSDAAQAASAHAPGPGPRGRAATTRPPLRAPAPALAGRSIGGELDDTVSPVTRMPGARSGSALPRLKPQLLSPEAEALRLSLQADDITYWKARANRLMSQPGQANRARYAENRANALARPLRRKLERCGRRGTMVKCGCPGKREPALYGCRSWWFCGDCRARRGRRLGRRLTDSLTHHLDAARKAWVGYADKAPIVHLVTLTVQHSGDLTADRAAIADGWRGLYLHLREELGRVTYALVWEVTPGRDGLGHVHAHVALVAPWFEYGDARRVWLRHCPRSARINIVPGTSGARGAAKYLGKYMSKGVESHRFDAFLRAQVAAAFYGQRSVTTSHRFFLAFTPCCPACGQRIVAALDARVAAWRRAASRHYRPHLPGGAAPDERHRGGPPRDLWDAAGLLGLDEYGQLQVAGRHNGAAHVARRRVRKAR